jgi:N-methylhydantoinase B/oxoprolinase/acetone carboxylase alpha subunit
LAAGHLPDYVLVTPVFRHSQVVAFMGTIAHVSDVGGHPGDLESYDVFTEGVRIPPCKLYEAGEPNELIFNLLSLTTARSHRRK